MTPISMMTPPSAAATRTPRTDPVARWPFEERLAETFRRALPKLGPEAREQIAALISPASLAIIAGVLVAWVVSHAFGLGEIIDVVLLTVGAVAIGWAVFDGIDHLWDFAHGTYRAQSEHDLEVAADHLAQAIAILGIQAVLAIILRGAPRTGRGGRSPVGAPPPPGRYRPTVTRDPSMKAGEGATDVWGNVTIGTQGGSATDVALALLHERVHAFLSPTFDILRLYRASNRTNSYVRSSLWRYIEEALAETIAQVGVQGFLQVFRGLRFPFQNGYVYLVRGGADTTRFAGFGGQGVLSELGALLATGVVAGIPFELWITYATPPVTPEPAGR